MTFRLLQSQDVLGSSMVATGRVDVEITSRRPRNPAVRWQPLLSEQLFLALPPDHAWADRDSIGLAEVADEDFVILRPEWELRQVTDRLCEAAGIRPHVVFEGDDLLTIGGLVAAGLGVPIVPAQDADRASPRPGDPRLVPLTDDGASRDIGLAWPSDRRLLPAAAAVPRPRAGGPRLRGGRRPDDTPRRPAICPSITVLLHSDTLPSCP